MVANAPKRSLTMAPMLGFSMGLASPSVRTWVLFSQKAVTRIIGMTRLIWKLRGQGCTLLCLHIVWLLETAVRHRRSDRTKHLLMRHHDSRPIWSPWGNRFRKWQDSHRNGAVQFHRVCCSSVVVKIATSPNDGKFAKHSARVIDTFNMVSHEPILVAIHMCE